MSPSDGKEQDGFEINLLALRKGYLVPRRCFPMLVDDNRQLKLATVHAQECGPTINANHHVETVKTMTNLW